MVGHKFLGGAGWGGWWPPPPWSVGCAPGGAEGKSHSLSVSTATGPGGVALARRAWGISPHAAASFFLDAQKEAKEAPGGATGRTSALRPRSPCCLPPGPPFYGGRQLGSSCGFPKGAGGVGIDIASPTAAADWVVFPLWWFLRLKARLCVRWGTSSAVVEGVVTSTTLERWPRRRRRGRGIPPSSVAHRTRARWPGGSWEHPLRFPRAGTAPPGIRRIPP